MKKLLTILLSVLMVVCVSTINVLGDDTPVDNTTKDVTVDDATSGVLIPELGSVVLGYGDTLTINLINSNIANEHHWKIETMADNLTLVSPETVVQTSHSNDPAFTVENNVPLAITFKAKNTSSADKELYVRDLDHEGHGFKIKVTVGEPSSLSSNINDVTFIAGATNPTEFTFTTTANCDAGRMVTGSSDFSGVTNYTLEAWEPNGSYWFNMVGISYGASSVGFPMSNATSTFRAKFLEGSEGKHSFVVTMDEVGTNNEVCSLDCEFVIYPNIKNTSYTYGEKNVDIFSTQTDFEFYYAKVGTELSGLTGNWISNVNTKSFEPGTYDVWCRLKNNDNESIKPGKLGSIEVKAELTTANPPKAPGSLIDRWVKVGESVDVTIKHIGDRHAHLVAEDNNVVVTKNQLVNNKYYVVYGNESANQYFNNEKAAQHVTIRAKGAGKTTLKVLPLNNGRYMDNNPYTRGYINIYAYSAPTLVDSLIYNRSAQSLIDVNGEAPEGYTIKYAAVEKNAEAPIASAYDTDVKETNIGTYDVYFEVVDSSSNVVIEPAKVGSVEIKPELITANPAASITRWIEVDDTGVKVTIKHVGTRKAHLVVRNNDVIENNGISQNDNRYYVVYGDNNNYLNASKGSVEVTIKTKAAGISQVKVLPIGDNNRYMDSSPYTRGYINVYSYIAPELVTGLKYTGREQDLITEGSLPSTDYEFEYSVDGGEWSTDVPSATDAGSYGIEWRIVNKEGEKVVYVDGDLGSTTIKKATLTASETVNEEVVYGTKLKVNLAELVSTDAIYNEFKYEILSITKDGETFDNTNDMIFMKKSDGKLVFYAGNDVGEYKVTVKVKVQNKPSKKAEQVPEKESNYVDGTITKDIVCTVVITPYDITESDVVIEIKSDLVYSGLGQNPISKITFKGEELTEDVDYEISYKTDNVNAEEGKTVYIEGIGNFKGKVEKQFTIEKAPNQTLDAYSSSVIWRYYTSEGKYKAKATCADLLNVELDGEDITNKEGVTIEEGSTIVTLNKTILNNLDYGKHYLVLNYRNYESVTFVITVKEYVPTPYKAPTTGIE